MALKVDFLGPTRQIAVKAGVTDIDIQVDVYSDWKEWVLEDDNSKFLPALRTVGGDPLGAGEFIGRYFLLTNGWQLMPTSGTLDDVLLTGNIFHDDGINILNTFGTNVQLYQNIASSLTVISEVSSSAPAGLTPSQENMLLKLYDVMGLDPTKPLVVTPEARTVTSSISQSIETVGREVTVTRTL